MNPAPQQEQNLWQRITSAIFLITYALPIGWEWEPADFFHEKIIIPISAIALILNIITEKKTQRTTKNKVLIFLLIFLWITSTTTSINTEYSTKITSIFSLGILFLFFESKLFTFPEKHLWISTGTILATFINIIFPEQNISTELIGLGSLLGIIFSLQKITTPSAKGTFLVNICTLIWINNILFILASMLLLWSIRFWLPKEKQRIAKKFSLIGLGILITGTILQYKTGAIHFEYEFPWENFLTKKLTIFFGAGLGNFQMFQEQYRTTLTATPLIQPSSSFLYILTETGIIGTSLIGSILFSFFTKNKRPIFWSIIIFSILLISKDLTQTTNGIILLLPLLLGEIENKEKRERTITSELSKKVEP